MQNQVLVALTQLGENRWLSICKAKKQTICLLQKENNKIKN
jgi:hypothetical protein